MPETYVVVSPSFTLANEYPGPTPFYHLDAYRLDGAGFVEAGLDEYFTRPGVVAVEWAERIEEYLPDERLEVALKPVESGGREAVLEAYGKRYEEVIRKIEENW